ncbi:AAA family ATPase [Polymorphum gilvum]|uniref:Transposase protein B n=1 Tax=Polymorphum gilvum (strain LMG 25793 / CGMCC 1.9160 / SL003B-26A1) TaxID=991905 RepID=F2J664_POLGS|nr:ATP-binding protein [Polymorphum gilvum]ADZ72428.1 Transposase protein B [Polymorphum gilvum SL003B-26A1]
MTAPLKNVKTAARGSIAPLKNVAALMTLIEALRTRAVGLPGIGVFSGDSGYGKSVAAQYAINKTGAVYVEVRHYWRQKRFCEALLQELGQPRPRGTVAALMDDIIYRLGDAPHRPLIIDEADKLVDGGMIEFVRDIHETTQVPVILIGEELLPRKLEAHERVHNRVLDFQLAQPCDSEDTTVLARFLCPGVEIAPDLLEDVRRQTAGKARRIATTLHEIGQFARNSGLTAVERGSYGGRIFTGETPIRRAGGRG